MKIAIAVHGRFHAFDLANAVRPIACVRQVATTYPALVARRFLEPDIPLKTAPWLEVLRRLHGRFGIGPRPDAAISRRFGRFAARTLPKDCDVFVGWSSASLEAIEAAKARGVLAVLERGSTHVLHQQDVLARIHDRAGRRFEGIDPEIVTRELAEYAAADRIAVPTRFAAETFIGRGIDAEKLLINPYGVDAGRFAAPDRRPRDKPAILFVGAVGRQKGAPELCAAFAGLHGAASLVFAGPVETGWAPPQADGIKFLGAIDRNGVVAALRDAEIFCLPSHQEGLSLSLLQAMAAGLPIVATPESGAADVVEDGVEGRIVPAGDAGALTAALHDLVANPEMRAAMGQNARAKALALSWGAYGERAVAGYRAALAARAGDP